MLTTDQLAAALTWIREAPRGRGTLELIVCRPGVGARAVIDEVTFDLELGVVGDTWSTRTRPGGLPPNPEAQVTIMSARVAEVIAGAREAWPAAGDQLYVDLALDVDVGTRFAVGTSVLEVSASPHTGCAKFTQRFGSEVTRWVNSREGRALNLRGINARIIQAGVARRGDVIAHL